jgi:hypothetical protein
MGQQRDYASLARSLGGAPVDPSQDGPNGAGDAIDYGAMARQLGGSVVPSGRGRAPSLPPMPMAVSHRQLPAQTAGRFAREATQSVNPVNIVRGVSDSVLHPIDTTTGILSAHDQLRAEAAEAFNRGDYLAAVRHLSEYLVPYGTGVAGAAAGMPGGPPGIAAGAAGGYGLGVGLATRMDDAADRFLEGDYAGGAGASVDAAVMAGLGGRGMMPAQPRVVSTREPRGPAALVRRGVEAVTPKKLTPSEDSALAFARARGIPLDVGTATGRQFLKNQQKAAGAYGPAESFRATQAAEITRVGRELAADAGPRPMTPVTAGESVRSAVQGRIGNFHRLANDAYTRLRHAEMASPEEFVQVRPQKPVASHVTSDQAFPLRWLAKDLEDFQFQQGGTSLSTRRRAYESLDPVEAQALYHNPRVAGTPVQEMFHAMGIKGSRAEIATKVERFLSGQNKDPKFARLADALNEAWDGQRFDFDLVSDETLTGLGVRRRDLKSPIGLPDFAEPGAARFFPEDAIPAAPGGARRSGAGDTPMRAAFDLRPHKEALRSLYDELAAERDITGSLLGSKGRAAVALEALINGPDFAPVSAVDAALGSLKGLARGASMPQLRNRGQGVAARIVGELETGLRARVNDLGGDMAQALSEGRAATKSKYQSAETLKLLPAESARVFSQLTSRDDAGIRKLRAIAAETPDEIPNIARAYLEHALTRATADGNILNHGQQLWADWQKLGPESRHRLFPREGQAKQLDQYFLAVKKITENPNPSNTAQVYAVIQIHKWLPAWAMAKVLYAPDGARTLNTARMLLQSRSKAADALALTQVARAAQAAGVPLESVPALAAGAETPKPSERRK